MRNPAIMRLPTIHIDRATLQVTAFFRSLIPGHNHVVEALSFPRARVEEIIKYIDRVKRSIELCIYQITCKKLANALVTAGLVREVQVRLIAGKTCSKTSDSKIEFLRFHGIVAHQVKAKLMHIKFVIIDDELLLNGSMNWSEAGYSANVENVFGFRSHKIRSDDHRFVSSSIDAHASGSREVIRMNYVPYMKEILLQKLLSGDEHIDEMIELLDSCEISREDLIESMESFKFPGVKCHSYSELGTKAKTAFTCQYNKAVHKAQGVVESTLGSTTVQKGCGKAAAADDDDALPPASAAESEPEGNNDELDVSKFRNKPRGKAAASGAAATKRKAAGGGAAAGKAKAVPAKKRRA